MRVKECWLLTNAVCLPRDGGSNFVLEPPIPFVLTPSFIIFDSIYTGELEVTGEYTTTVDSTTLNTINTLRNLGVSYISGLQDISVSFKNEAVNNVSPVRSNLHYSPFVKLIRTQVLSAVDESPVVESVAVTDWETLPTNKPWYPVSWSGATLLPIAAGNEGYLAGFIRYPIDGKAVLRTTGFLPFPTPLINDDYFLDLTAPNYISLTPPVTSTVVAIGKGIDQYTLQLNIEVKVWR